MMARRIIAKSLLLRESAIRSNNNNSSCSIILASHHHHHRSHRHQSSQAAKPRSQLPEIEREEYDVGMKLLEDHIQRMIVKKATPDWLPFLPGSSFWVPPTPSPSTFFHNISSQPNLHNPLALSLRDSPTSQNLFIPENEYAGVEVNNTTEGLDVVTVKVKVLTMPENITLSEDEEG